MDVSPARPALVVCLPLQNIHVQVWFIPLADERRVCR